MSTRTIARRTRAAVALAASAALLSLAACGSDGGETETPAPTTGTEASDGGGQQVPPAEDDGADDSTSDDDTEDTDDTETDTDGDDSDGDDSSADDDADAPDQETGASGERTRIMLVTDLGIDDTTGDGPLTLQNEQLATLLSSPFDATAECAEELVLEPGNAAGCVGPVSLDRTEPTQEWVATAVRIPQAEDPASGSQDAVLFSTGVQLPEDAEDLTDEDTVLTGVGFGSAFGMEPLSAEEVAESTLSTLTSEFAYVPVGAMADWSEVTCEDGLDFNRFETVDCTATTADGESWDLAVAPGTYANNDQGLLVGIDTQREG